jgi:uroporphyrinogen-III synthase
MGMARQSEASSTPGLGTPVLVTRPETEALAFAAALTSRFGWTVRPIVAPLMASRFLTPKLPDGPFAGVIFTSARAVEAGMAIGATLPRRAFCVGRKTAEAAAAAGFQAESADGDADALVALVVASRPDGPLLYLRGVDSRGEVAERLNSLGIYTQDLVVYRQEPQALGPAGLVVLQEPGKVIVPLFSPRSALLFRNTLPPAAKASLYLAAISQAVVEVAIGLPSVVLEVAPRPDAAAMLDTVGKLLEDAPPP